MSTEGIQRFNNILNASKEIEAIKSIPEFNTRKVQQIGALSTNNSLPTNFELRDYVPIRDNELVLQTEWQLPIAANVTQKMGESEVKYGALVRTQGEVVQVDYSKDLTPPSKIQMLPKEFEPKQKCVITDIKYEEKDLEPLENHDYLDVLDWLDSIAENLDPIRQKMATVEVSELEGAKNGRKIIVQDAVGGPTFCFFIDGDNQQILVTHEYTWPSQVEAQNGRKYSPFLSLKAMDAERTVESILIARKGPTVKAKTHSGTILTNTPSPPLSFGTIAYIVEKRDSNDQVGTPPEFKTIVKTDHPVNENNNSDIAQKEVEKLPTVDGLLKIFNQRYIQRSQLAG